MSESRGKPTPERAVTAQQTFFETDPPDAGPPPPPRPPKAEPFSPPPPICSRCGSVKTAGGSAYRVFSILSPCNEPGLPRGFTLCPDCHRLLAAFLRRSPDG